MEDLRLEFALGTSPFCTGGYLLRPLQYFQFIICLHPHLTCALALAGAGLCTPYPSLWPPPLQTCRCWFLLALMQYKATPWGTAASPRFGP